MKNKNYTIFEDFTRVKNSMDVSISLNTKCEIRGFPDSGVNVISHTWGMISILILKFSRRLWQINPGDNNKRFSLRIVCMSLNIAYDK